MLWLLLIFTWTFFNEISNSITKTKSQKNNIYSLWLVISLFWTFIFLGILIFKLFFISGITINYNIKSLPITILRTLLEIVLMYVWLMATKHCDRSTYTIIRSVTIPLLLIIDILLWYEVTRNNLIGLLIIFWAFLFFNLWPNSTLNFRWWKYALWFAILASLTTSLYKYNISNFWNSVEIEQFSVFLSFLLFYLYKDYKETWLEWLKLITQKAFLLQGLTMITSTLLISYAFLLVNASTGMAIKRSWSLIWGILFWKFVFNEEKIRRKLLMWTFVIIGVFFIVYRI